jgi:hypothetical protein
MCWNVRYFQCGFDPFGINFKAYIAYFKGFYFNTLLIVILGFGTWASLRRKIEQKLGIEGSLDALENKTKDLFKGFRF